jgi:flagellar motor component MotA
MVLYHIEALLVLIFGSSAILMFSMGWLKVKTLIKNIKSLNYAGKNEHSKQFTQDIMKFNDAFHTRAKNLNVLISEVNYDFFKEALVLLSERILDDKSFEAILKSKAESIYKSHLDLTNAVKRIANYPTIIGNIVFFAIVMGFCYQWSQVGGTMMISKIGLALAISLPYPFYAFLIKEGFLLRAAERLTDNAKKTYHYNLLVCEGVTLIAKNTNPIVVLEKLNALLPPAERVFWQDALAYQLKLASPAPEKLPKKLIA